MCLHSRKVFNCESPSAFSIAEKKEQIMDNEKLNTKVYEKAFSEQEEFRKWLLAQSPEEILNHAYEYTSREDILLSLEYNDLSDEQAKALLKSKDVLSDVFKDFEKKETDHMEDIGETVKGRANTIIERQKHEKQMER